MNFLGSHPTLSPNEQRLSRNSAMPPTHKVQELLAPEQINFI